MNTQHWDDPHITTAESTFISSSRRSFMFLSIWKAFQSFLLCSRNATGQAFETLFPASMCVTYFQRASPGRPCPLAGWLRCQQTQAKPSWGSSDWDWHCVLALLGSAETWQPEIPCLLLLCRRERHSLLLKVLATISGQFGSNNSWLCREPHPALIILNIWR